MFMILMVVLLVAVIGGGGWGYSRFGWQGLTPAGAILLVFAVLFFTGTLHFR